MNGLDTGGGAISGSPGDQFPHQPVLYHEVLDALTPVSGSDYLDGTLGAGGHAEGILQASAPQGRLLGLDLDLEALAIAHQRLFAYQDRVILRHASYRDTPEILKEVGWQHVHGILLDLGISSMQIDRPDRGFSFSEKGPLDMRFDQDSGLSAAELVNTLSEEALIEILQDYGEERYAKRIARAIIAAKPILTTQALAAVVKKAVPFYSSNIHPATRTFQALRIATNKELETLSAALPALLKCLAPHGRFAVISFHSLEDRIVKRFFRTESRDCICPPELPTCTCGHSASLKILTKKPVRPDSQEIQDNPRARSARLRVAEKIIKKA
jgi:16S rRNA (cytosine1402-N4)-methyltransferase